MRIKPCQERLLINYITRYYGLCNPMDYSVTLPETTTRENYTGTHVIEYVAFPQRRDEERAKSTMRLL